MPLSPSRRGLVPPFIAMDVLREACLKRGVEILTGLNVDTVMSRRVRAGQKVFDAADIVIDDYRIKINWAKGDTGNVARTEQRGSRMPG